MLTDTAIRSLKTREKPYKVTDRDGMYVLVSVKGSISFRLDYRLHGRRETIVLGKYGPDGLSLARAREKCIDARRLVAEGQSPAIEKQREKRRIKEAKSFGEFGEKYNRGTVLLDAALRERFIVREHLRDGRLNIHLLPADPTFVASDEMDVIIGLTDRAMPEAVDRRGKGTPVAG